MIYSKTLKNALACGAILVIANLSTPAFAKVPEAQVNRLGNDLTPVGAEKAGVGIIPAWTGGLRATPADNFSFDPERHQPNPYPDDKVQYTIDQENMSQYDAILTEGTKALLSTYPTYKMNVYQTRRSCGYPDFVYAATRNNAETGELVDSGSGVADAIMGFPFPIPNNALEIVWNHTLRYRSFKLTRESATAAVTATGDYTLSIVKDKAMFRWSDPTMSVAADLNNISFYYLANTLAPARAAGNVTLLHESLNRTAHPRKVWQYSPGTRRVRRAPNVAYDNPGANTDGLSTTDSFDSYNGAPDRYDWTVLGKSPRLVVNNSYMARDASFEEFLQPSHVNQDVVRYELSRVWQIEANLIPDTRHIYSRRVYSLDEDSWQIVAGELYDTRGELWRVQEAHQTQYYVPVPLCGRHTELVYDLSSGRYLAATLANGGRPNNFAAEEVQSQQFSPATLGQEGRR